MNTIHRKGLYQFEGQPIGSKGWFKLDIEFLNTFFSKIHPEFYKEPFKKNIEDQDMELYKTFRVLFDKKLIIKKRPNMITQSEEPAPEEIVVRKYQRYTSSYTSYLSSSTVETGLTGVTRVNVTPEKLIPKKHKYIKPTALSPFLPGNKILLNEENDDNPETTSTSLSGKDDMSQSSKVYVVSVLSSLS